MNIVQNLLAPFLFQEECRVKIAHEHSVSIWGFFFQNLWIRVSDGHFYCIHTFTRVHVIRFWNQQIESLKSDGVNGPTICSLGEELVNITKQAFRDKFQLRFLKENVQAKSDN